MQKLPVDALKGAIKPALGLVAKLFGLDTIPIEIGRVYATLKESVPKSLVQIFNRVLGKNKSDEGKKPNCPQKGPQKKPKPLAPPKRMAPKLTLPDCVKATCSCFEPVVDVRDGHWKPRSLGKLFPNMRVSTLPDWNRGVTAQSDSFSDAAKVRLVHVKVMKEDSLKREAWLFRPEEWLVEAGVIVGGRVWLDLPEMGFEGSAEVLSIEGIEELEQGPGRLVTALFIHYDAEVWDLRVEGESRAIGVTVTHPFWSVTRRTWMSAAELQAGELLLAEDGRTPRVLSFTKREGREPVYNIEVDGDHVYRVGEQGLLVHNASTPCADNGLMQGDSKILDKDTTIVYERTSANARKGAPYQYVRVKKIVISQQYEGSFRSREPDDFMRHLIKYGLLAYPGDTLGLQPDDVGHIIGNQFGGYANRSKGQRQCLPPKLQCQPGQIKFL